MYFLTETYCYEDGPGARTRRVAAFHCRPQAHAALRVAYAEADEYDETWRQVSDECGRLVLPELLGREAAEEREAGGPGWDDIPF